MAEPLTPAGTMPDMESAVRLLRQAPLATLVCHWAGSAPFVLGVLAFWNDISNPRTPGATGAVEAFALALLLIWMNCWRAVFAGRLRRQLGDTADSTWTGRRVVNLIASQAFFGATKLLMVPVSLLILFPLASTVAFYRYSAVLADREDLDPLELMVKARQLAGLQARQSWALLPPLAFLYLLVVVNLGIALGLLPQLVRILTGYESAFSRSGFYFAVNPLFFLLVIAVSWIAFDPFVQAVYCVRCFRGESLETGEDLRAGLRLIRRGAQVLAVALVFLARAGPASAGIAPAELEKSVRQSMQSHEYDWRLPPGPVSAGKRSWVVTLADRLIASVKSVSSAIEEAVRRFFRWIRGDSATPGQSGTAPTTGLDWSVYALTALVILAAMGVYWRGRQLRRETPDSAAGNLAAVIRLDAEDLTPDRLPEERWLELAGQCLREENFRLALRALYLANLAWLGRRELLSIDPGKTNREYELELLRRARAFPEARGLFARNVAAFERAWYGLHEVAAEDVAEFRTRTAQMKEAAA